MDFILSLAHFCEIHGPTSILCTQLSATPSIPTAAEIGNSCANCTFNVPFRSAHSTPSPVLRSRLDRPEEKNKQDEEAEDSDSVFPDLSCSPTSSTHSTSMSTPLHFITSHEPSSHTSFSLLRSTCIRVLSVESLPRGNPDGPLTIDTAADPRSRTEEHRTVAVSYVFRIPDPRARGRRRTYAFLALGGSRGWILQRQIQRSFQCWAREMQGAAERGLVQQREMMLQQMGSPPPPPMSSGGLDASKSHDGAQDDGESEIVGILSRSVSPTSPVKVDRLTSPIKASHSRNNSTSIAGRNITPVSSFLSAKEIDPDGFPRSTLSKARTLTEILGDEWFFVRLHGQFCGLLRALME